MFSVVYLGGDIFINGIILGMSEMISAITGGFIVKCRGAVRAFQILAVLGLGFNTLLQFVFNTGAIIDYFILFFAMQGIGGVYAC